MDSEDELKCKVCLLEFDNKELKPRILPCLHVVCHSCLQMVLGMAVRDRKHQDDVIVLKCPICRTTQPLTENDVNSFPVNKKILQNATNRSSTSETDVKDDVDNVTERLGNVAVSGYGNDRDQTIPMMVPCAQHLGHGRRNQTELSSRRRGARPPVHRPAHRPAHRRTQNTPHARSAWNDGSYNHSFIPRQIQATRTDGTYNHGFIPGQFQGLDDFEEMDDMSYMDDVIQQLAIASENGREQQANNQAKESENTRSKAVSEKEEEDDVMAAIKRSCAKMYGDPDSTKAAADDDDLVTEGTEKPQPNLQHGRGSVNGIERHQSNFMGDWRIPDPTGGMVGRPYNNRGTYHRSTRNQHFVEPSMFQRTGFPGAQHRRPRHSSEHAGAWENQRNKDHFRYEDDEEAMLKQLQKEADHSPVAAELLEEMMRVKSMKEAQSNAANSNGAANDEFVAASAADDDTDDIVDLLKKQGDTNPEAAEIVRDMELVERLSEQGHLAPLEDQSIIEQALHEADTHPEARVVVDDILAMKTGTTNTKDDVLEELMRASKSTDEARRVLDDMLNREGHAQQQDPPTKGKRKNFEDPNSLVEEVLRDKNVSAEEKNKFISEIAAGANGCFEKEDTLSMLMQESAENPLAAQILHDMLYGSNQQ